MKSVFVTGASGFIGGHIARALAARWEVCAPAHSELELSDEAAVSAFFSGKYFDAVIHCAAKPGHRNAKDPSGIFYENTRQFFNLARQKSRFRKMIFISSGMVYDRRHYIPLMKEDYFDAHVPADEAGFAKYVCAKYAEAAENIIELRPFGVYGPGEDYAIRFISNAVCKAVCGLPITVKRNRKFDYVHVDDLVLAVEHFIASDGKHKSYNAASGKPVELVEIARKVAEISGSQTEIIVREQGMDAEYSADIARLAEEIPGFPRVSLDDGIRELYDWYLARKDTLNKECLLFDK